MEILDKEIQEPEPAKTIPNKAMEFIRYALPLAITGVFRLTMVGHNHNPDGGPDLYGFPMAFMTSRWVNSFEHEVFLTGLFIDLVFYALLAWFLLSPLIGKLKKRWLKNLVTFGLWGLAVTKLIPLLIFFDYLSFLWVCRQSTDYMEYGMHIGFIPI